MQEKKTIEEIMKEGWTEELEFGFGRSSVLYSKKDDRMIYDEIKQQVVVKYNVGMEYVKR